MEQVGARDVSPVVAAVILENVEEMVAALPEDRAVRIKGHRLALGDDEVITGPVRIAEQFFAERAGGTIGSVSRAGHSPGLDRFRSRQEEGTGLVELKSALGDARGVEKGGRGEGFHAIRRGAVLEVPPGERRGIGRLVRFQCGDLLRGQRAGVDAGVVDRAEEEAIVRAGVEMAQAQQDHAVDRRTIRRPRPCKWPSVGRCGKW